MKKLKFKTIESAKKFKSMKDKELTKLEMVKGGACFPAIFCIMCVPVCYPIGCPENFV